MLRNRTQVKTIGKDWPPASARRSDGEQRGVLLAALFMFVIGWGGLLNLVISTRPRIGGEIWLFFILLQIAVTGTAIPILCLVSQRLRPVNDRVPLAGVVVRRSVWIGIIVVTCAWLMIPRYMSAAYSFDFDPPDSL